MTVPASQANRYTYAGNGVTTTFAYSSKFLANADLVVVSVNDTTGVETVKTLTTDYTVTGAGTSAGTVTMLTAPASGTTLVIYGDPVVSQLVDPVNGDDLDVDVVIEAPLDRLTIIARRLKDIVTRTLRQPEGDTADIDRLPAKADRASMFLAFDSNGDPIAASGTTETPVSAFMATVLDDTTAAAARTTLGAIGEGDFTAAGQILIGQASGDAVAVANPLGGAQIINGKISLSVGSSALTVSLKGLDGNDPSASNPVFIRIPQNTAGVFDGTYAVRKVTAALSMVVSSGSTLGHTSAVACPVYFYLIDNAGTPELAVSTKFFGTPAVVTTVAEGGAGAADTATTMYSTTLRSNVSASLIGRWKSTQATAGTWAAVTGEQQLYPFPRKKKSMQRFVASGTYTKPWDALFIRAELDAAGGAGGGSGAAAGASGGSGGSAGGSADLDWKDAAEIPATVTVTLGAAGVPGAAGAVAGGNASASSFGSLLAANGGIGGNFGTNNGSAQGVTGGIGTTGDVLLRGGDSVGGAGVTSAWGMGGKGGDSRRGGGGLGGHSGNAGNAGGNYGSGGGGGSVTGGGGTAGGAGAGAILEVEEAY